MTILEQYASADLASEALELALRSLGAGDRVRAVHRLPEPFHHLVAKRFASDHRTRARREFGYLCELHRAGLRVPAPVALVEDLRRRALFVLMEHVPRTRTLHACIEAGLAEDRARRIARSLGRLVRAMHDHGIRHRDLHAGNVLVTADDQVFLLDLHRARGPRALSRRRRTRELLDLSHFVQGRVSPAVLHRFLHAYGAPIWPARVRRRRELRVLEQKALRSLRRFLRHHEKRCTGSGRHFERLRHGGDRGVAARGTEPSLWQELTHPGTLETARLLHRGRESRVLRVRTADGAAFVVKEYTDPGLLGLVKRLLRGSRARRAWRNTFRLQMADVDVPRPLAFLESPWWRSPRTSWLLMEDLEGATVLDRSVPSVHLDRLAEHIARLHDHALSHRDLKAENFLFLERDSRLVWVDPDGLRRRRPSPARRAKDLVRLNASFPGDTINLRQRLRWLRLYRARSAAAIPGAQFANQICAGTRRKWERQAHARLGS